MGANVSTVEESTAYVAPLPTNTSRTVFTPNNAYSYHNDSTNPSRNNNSSSNLFNSSPSLTRNYPSNNEDKRKIHPSAALLPSPNYTSKSRRVIYFHSTQSCRGYLEASKASNTLIVIGFTNGWCRYMEPTLHEFGAKFTNIEFLKIDVDELYDISRQYRVHKTPTFILMRKGKLLDKVVGTNKEELRKKIEIHI